MKKLFVVFISIVCSLRLTAQSSKDGREYYQVTVYHFKTEDQKQRIDSFLQQALLPALHRMKMKNIGAFTPIGNDTLPDKKVITIIPAGSLEQLLALPDKLSKDETYQLAGKSFLEATYSNPPYTRLEKILAHAFPKAVALQLPKLSSPKAEHVYEFRSYESPTEKLFRNKVEMFNEGGEVSLFKRLNFNAIFYAEVIAGASMPNLVYMTSFENRADRDAHWKTFSDDVEWKKLSGDPYYQHNVSKADIMLMKAADYSDY